MILRQILSLISRRRSIKVSVNRLFEEPVAEFATPIFIYVRAVSLANDKVRYRITIANREQLWTFDFGLNIEFIFLHMFLAESMQKMSWISFWCLEGASWNFWGWYLPRLFRHIWKCLEEDCTGMQGMDWSNMESWSLQQRGEHAPPPRAFSPGATRNEVSMLATGSGGIKELKEMPKEDSICAQ